MERKNYRFMHMPDDRVLLGIAAGFLSGLFSGAFAGVALTLLLNSTPEGSLGVGAYVLEGAVIGMMIGMVIGIESYGIRNTKTTRWYWAATTAAAAAFAVIITENYSSFQPKALIIIPFISAVTGWVVEHTLLSVTNTREIPKKKARSSSLILFLIGFTTCVLFIFIAISLYWQAAAAID
jgi:MFS family permease